MLELIAAMSIMAIVMAVAVPSMAKLYDSMQYRQAVRETIALLGAARHRAVNTGVAQDVLINTTTRQLTLNTKTAVLPEGVNVVVHAAGELNQKDAGVIRFYPQGGSSGGAVDIENPGAYGVKISVDWLVGRISQEKYALN